MSKPPKNYRWWQDHGAGWFDEVAARKAHMPIYHLQEMFLDEYFSELAPAKVLEFGCGFGRHLEYLRRVPKLEVYGFDQSESMVSGMRWARKPWREKRIRVGPPLRKLPYEDGEFDVVFTVSVLIHIRPKDLDAVLAELWRVSGGHVVHIENVDTDETIVTSEAHDGCWAHDLRSAYRRVAPQAQFEVAPSMFEIEDVYRVLDKVHGAPVLMGKRRAAKLRQLDDSISGEIRRLRETSNRAENQSRVLVEESNTLSSRLKEQCDRTRQAEESLASAVQKILGLNTQVADQNRRIAEESAAVEGLQLRAAEFRERLEAEVSRGDHYAEGLMRVQNAQERVIGQERDAQSRLIALRRRAESAERDIIALRDRAVSGEHRVDDMRERAELFSIKAEEQRVRARDAEEKVVALQLEIKSQQELYLHQRRRADEALGYVDDMRERAEVFSIKAEEQRVRARDAEEKVIALQLEIKSEQDLCLHQRRRADEALGRIDLARREQEQAESELDALRTMLGSLLDQ